MEYVRCSNQMCEIAGGKVTKAGLIVLVKDGVPAAEGGVIPRI